MGFEASVIAEHLTAYTVTACLRGHGEHWPLAGELH